MSGFVLKTDAISSDIIREKNELRETELLTGVWNVSAHRSERASVRPAPILSPTHSFPRAERSLPRWGSAGSTATPELRGRAAARGLRREAALPRTHHGTVDRWIPLRISDTQLWQDPRRGSSNGSRTMLCETVLAKSHRGASQKILRSFLSYLW